MCAILKGILFFIIGNIALGEIEINREIEKISWSQLFFSRPTLKIEPQSLHTSKYLSYQGIVVTHGKKPTYWINREMQQTLPNGAVSKRGYLLLGEGKKHIQLTAGEKYDLEDKMVSLILDEEN